MVFIAAKMKFNDVSPSENITVGLGDLYDDATSRFITSLSCFIVKYYKAGHAAGFKKKKKKQITNDTTKIIGWTRCN